MHRLVCLVLFGLLLVAPAAGRGSLTPAGEPPPTAQIVAVGFLPLTIAAIDIADSSYYLDGYLWFRWSGDIDPSRSYEIINIVERADYHEVPTYEAPILLPTGESYQVIRISGRFHQRFDLSAFPLDRQTLAIQIEDQRHTIEELAYVPDIENSGLSSMLRAGTWAIEGWSMQALRHDYGTNFGAMIEEEVYSLLGFSIEIARPVRYFVWKLLLPLTVLLAAALSSTLLPRRADVRVSVPVLALLATVVLQQSYSSTLPEVGYLVLMDQIFVLGFVIMVATGLRAVITAGRFRRLEEAGGPMPSAASLLRGDLIFLAAMSLLVALGSTVIVLMH